MAPRLGAKAPERMSRADEWDTIAGALQDYAPTVERVSAHDRTTLGGGRLSEEVHAEAARLPEGHARQAFLRGALEEDAPNLPE